MNQNYRQRRGVYFYEDELETEIDSLPTIEKTKEFVSFETLLDRSRRLGIHFKTSSNLIQNLEENDLIKEQITSNARNSYPIIHERIISLMIDFILYKKKNGSNVEKEVYSNIDSVSKFIDRLLRKRPLAFLGGCDSYLLRDGQTSGMGGFEDIGTDLEARPLVLQDYLSYDEIALAALIGVSVPTHFINSGSRGNCGKPGREGTFEPRGVYVALVGARFEMPDQMESKHMLIQQQYNRKGKGYGPRRGPRHANLLDVWAQFYNCYRPSNSARDSGGRQTQSHKRQRSGGKLSKSAPAASSEYKHMENKQTKKQMSLAECWGKPATKSMLESKASRRDLEGQASQRCGEKEQIQAFGFPTYREAEQEFHEENGSDTERFTEVFYSSNSYLDSFVYKQRLRVTIEPFLLDANHRAQKENREAYVHAVGLGLGVWAIAESQGRLMVEVYEEIISEQPLPNISDLDFSYFPVDCRDCGGYEDGENFSTERGNNVCIHFSRREPASKLVGKHAGKLLVAMYAWDGNAYAGNEYYMGMLSASGDPAAACCSMIPELQNPYINPMVRGLNARVATKSSGLLRLEDFLANNPGIESKLRT